MLHPQIIDSLFAINIFLLFLINFKVGSNPAIPGIAEITMSSLGIFFSFKSKVLNIFVLKVFVFF